MILWETSWGCNVENRQARKSRGLPAPVGLKGKRLSNLSCPCAPSVSPGREVWTSRMDVTRSLIIGKPVCGRGLCAGAFVLVQQKPPGPFYTSSQKPVFPFILVNKSPSLVASTNVEMVGGDNLETFSLPQATLRSQLESWRAGRC